MPIAQVTFGASFGYIEDYADDYFAEGYTQVTYSGDHTRFETWTNLALLAIPDGLRRNPILHDLAVVQEGYSVHFEKFTIDTVELSDATRDVHFEKFLSDTPWITEGYRVNFEKVLADLAPVSVQFMVSHDRFDRVTLHDTLKLAVNKRLSSSAVLNENTWVQVAKPLMEQVPIVESLTVSFSRPLYDAAAAVDNVSWDLAKFLNDAARVDESMRVDMASALSSLLPVSESMQVQMQKPLQDQALLRDRISILMAPAFSPVMWRDFVNSTSLGDGANFTRATGATYFDSSGLLAYASSDVPRFDFDPLTLEPRGLLLEEAKTNLVAQSTFTPERWTLSANSVVTPQSGMAPDGSHTAARLGTSTVGSPDAHTWDGPEWGIYYGEGFKYVASVFIRLSTAPTNKQISLRLADNVFGENVSVVLDAATGTVSMTGAATEVGAVPCASGWTRIWVAATALSSASSYPPRVWALDALDLGEGWEFWGCQLEQGTRPSSYIPTAGAISSRAADALSYALGPWYVPTVGTLLLDAIPYGGSYNGFGARLHEDATNYIGTGYIEATTTSPVTYMVTDGSVALTFPAGPTTAPVGEPFVMASSWNQGQFVSAANGFVTPVASQVAGAPLANSLRIMAETQGVGGYNTAYIRRLAYYDQRLNDADLISLTT